MLWSFKKLPVIGEIAEWAEHMLWVLETGVQSPAPSGSLSTARSDLQADTGIPRVVAWQWLGMTIHQVWLKKEKESLC